jgi:hypothetical protein
MSCKRLKSTSPIENESNAQRLAKSSLSEDLVVRSQPISGNGGHDNYGRGEKVPVPKVKEIGD